MSIYDKIKKDLSDILLENEVPNFLYRYIYIAAYGMVLTYGEDYYSQIIDTISYTKIVYGIDELLSSNDGYMIDNTLMAFKTGLPSVVMYRFRKDNASKNISVYYYLCIDDRYDMSRENLLEFIVHELNHVFCSMNNGLYKYKGNNYFRTGLNVINLESGKYENKIINEIINSFMTEDIINNVIKSGFHVDYIECFDSGHFYAVGYSNYLDKFRRIYEIIRKEKNFYSNIINGNFDEFISCFNIGNNSSLEELFKSLDKVDSYVLEKNKDKAIRMLKNINDESDLIFDRMKKK